MKKKLLLILSCTLFLSMPLFGQQKGENENSNGNQDNGRVNLLLPHGNIGINTLSPSERLEVRGNVRVSNSIFANELEVVGLSSTNITVREDVRIGRNLYIVGNVGIGVAQPSERLDINGNLRVSSTIFSDAIEVNQLRGNNGTFNNSLLVKENFTVNGLTGLGVAAPTEKLEVAGNVRVSQGIFTSTLEGISYIVEEGTINNLLKVKGNTLVEGNLGIGTTSPAEKLDVNGNIKASGNLSGNDLFVNKANFSSDVAVNQNLAVSGTSNFSGQATATDLEVTKVLKTNELKGNNATLSGTLAVEGNAQLNGNAAISQNLSVAGTSNFTGKVTGTDFIVSNILESPTFRGNTGTFSGPLSVGGTTELVGNTSINQNLSVTGTSAFTGDVTTNNLTVANNLQSNSFTIANGAISNDLSVGGNTVVSGNTGLGIEAPVEKLEVAGNIKATGNLTGENLSAKGGEFTQHVNVGQNFAVAGTSSFTGKVNTQDLTVLNSLELKKDLTLGSKLGIGIATPEANLHVAGDSKLEGNTTATRLIVQDLEIVNLVQNTGQASFGNNLFVKGNLGVGTEKIDGYTLSVGGKIRASEDIRVYPAVEWADYVFEENYLLLPLQEVSEYIKTYNHLPDMPSAAEVKEQGIQLGEMDALLLQKIEELTLYIIQLESKNEQVKAEKEEMSAQLEQLRGDINSIKEMLGIRGQR